MSDVWWTTTLEILWLLQSSGGEQNEPRDVARDVAAAASAASPATATAAGSSDDSAALFAGVEYMLNS